MNAATQVAVIDTSSVIAIKEHLQLRHQRTVFRGLTGLVQAGRLFYPREVVWELAQYAGDDLPSGWASKNHDPQHDPSLETVKHVMGKAGDVVDPNKESEDADPYVLALAVEKANLFGPPVVVTEDTRDRPSRIAMTTACQRLGLPWKPVEDYCRAMGVWP